MLRSSHTIDCLYAHERRSHAIRLTGDPLEVRTEGAERCIVAGLPSDRAGDRGPNLTAILQCELFIHRIMRHPNLIADANAGRAEGDVHPVTTIVANGNSIAGEVIACLYAVGIIRGSGSGTSHTYQQA